MPQIASISEETLCDYCLRNITRASTSRETTSAPPISTPGNIQPSSSGAETRTARAAGQGVYLTPQASTSGERIVAQPPIVYTRRSSHSLHSDGIIWSSSHKSIGRPRFLYVYEYSSSSETVNNPHSLPKTSTTPSPTDRLAPTSIICGERSSTPPPDWNGPDDPQNPKIWPIQKRVFHTFIPAFYGFVL